MTVKNIILGITCSILCCINGFAQDKKKVAVVTFFVNKMVDVSAMTGNKMNDAILNEVMKLRDNPAFDLNGMFNNFHDTFLNTYSKSFPFDLLPESTVTSLPAYQDFQPKIMGFSTDSKSYLVPTGYKFIHDGMFGSYNEEGMTKMFAPLADGVMFVSVLFIYESEFGMAGIMTYKLKAHARISLYNNKTGKKVFAVKETGKSKKTFTAVVGIPTLNAADILPACQEAMADLMEDLNKKLEKITRKSAEKLE